MTIAAALSVNTFFGDGVTTSFSYTLPLNTTDGSDIQAHVVDNLGNETPLGGNYTVNVGLGTFNYPTAGGVAPLGVGVNALPTGWQLVLLRVEQLTQNLQLPLSGPFPSASVEAALDKLTMIAQQLQEQINRCYKTPPGSVPATTATPNVVQQQPFVTGTYAFIKQQAQSNPSFPFIGFVTDIAQGEFVLVFYTGNVATGDAGFIQP